MKKKKVVIIGGGHGQSTICRGVKNIENLDISAIVTVADDGGSTGRLRREFNIPAMGDIRNVMIALAAWSFLMPQDNPPSNDLSQDLEQTLLAAADQDQSTDSAW